MKKENDDDVMKKLELFTSNGDIGVWGSCFNSAIFAPWETRRDKHNKMKWRGQTLKQQCKNSKFKK